MNDYTTNKELHVSQCIFNSTRVRTNNSLAVEQRHCTAPALLPLLWKSVDSVCVHIFFIEIFCVFRFVQLFVLRFSTRCPLVLYLCYQDHICHILFAFPSLSLLQFSSRSLLISSLSAFRQVTFVYLLTKTSSLLLSSFLLFVHLIILIIMHIIPVQCPLFHICDCSNSRAREWKKA